MALRVYKNSTAAKNRLTPYDQLKSSTEMQKWPLWQSTCLKKNDVRETSKSKITTIPFWRVSPPSLIFNGVRVSFDKSRIVMNDHRLSIKTRTRKTEIFKRNFTKHHRQVYDTRISLIAYRSFWQKMFYVRYFKLFVLLYSYSCCTI